MHCSACYARSPPLVQGLDMVGMARTGSGKTAAFVIPMLERWVATVQYSCCD